MSSVNGKRRYLLIPVWILVLAIIALGVIQSGRPANLIDPEAFLFVLAGGIALVFISFPGTEIRRAFRDAVAFQGNDVDIKGSAHFWEAAGRGFWIVGVLRSILQLVMFFISMKTVEVAGLELLRRALAEYLLSTLFGMLLAVICFIPCWKLMGKLQNRPLAPNEGGRPMSNGRSTWSFGAVFGYFLFIAVLVFCFRKVPLSVGDLIALKPAMFVVLGGAIALMLFTRGINSEPMFSTAFAAMGIIGCLLGIVQMLFGLSEGAQGIGQVAGAFAFLISSCVTALFGMVLVGAPLEDRAIRAGRVVATSTFMRAAWYAFPLLALTFLVPMVLQLFVPLAGSQ
jgi:flagellar motor component MotA